MTYTVQTYDLPSTTLTAVAEDPAATVTVTRGGAAVSATEPLSLSRGETVFAVTVTSSSGSAQATYIVRVQNGSTQSPSGSGGGSASGSQSALLTIGGVSRTGVGVRISGGQATVSLGGLARYGIHFLRPDGGGAGIPRKHRRLVSRRQRGPELRGERTLRSQNRHCDLPGHPLQPLRRGL